MNNILIYHLYFVSLCEFVAKVYGNIWTVYILDLTNTTRAIFRSIPEYVIAFYTLFYIEEYSNTYFYNYGVVDSPHKYCILLSTLNISMFAKIVFKLRLANFNRIVFHTLLEYTKHQFTTRTAATSKQQHQERY